MFKAKVAPSHLHFTPNLFFIILIVGFKKWLPAKNLLPRLLGTSLTVSSWTHTSKTSWKQLSEPETDKTIKCLSGVSFLGQKLCWPGSRNWRNMSVSVMGLLHFPSSVLINVTVSWRNVCSALVSTPGFVNTVFIQVKIKFGIQSEKGASFCLQNFEQH